MAPVQPLGNRRALNGQIGRGGGLPGQHLLSVGSFEGGAAASAGAR